MDMKDWPTTDRQTVQTFCCPDVFQTEIAPSHKFPSISAAVTLFAKSLSADPLIIAQGICV